MGMSLQKVMGIEKGFHLMHIIRSRYVSRNKAQNYEAEKKVRSNNKPVEEATPANPPQPRLIINFESFGLKKFKENSKIYMTS